MTLAFAEEDKLLSPDAFSHDGPKTLLGQIHGSTTRPNKRFRLSWYVTDPCTSLTAKRCTAQGVPSIVHLYETDCASMGIQRRSLACDDILARRPSQQCTHGT